MNNKYKFVDGDCKTIYQVNSPDRLVPENEQHIIVKGKEYSVYRVDEIIDYDSFSREITIYLNNLN